MKLEIIKDAPTLFKCWHWIEKMRDTDIPPELAVSRVLAGDYQIMMGSNPDPCGVVIFELHEDKSCYTRFQKNLKWMPL